MKRETLDRQARSAIQQYTLIWLGLPVIAVLNGAIREFFFTDLLGELFAHQLSSFTIVIFISAYVWIAEGRWRLSSAREAAAVGAVWLVQTLLFEFLFGHYVMGHSWASLLADYNVFAGRFWSIVLFWTAVSPLVIYKVRE